MNEEYSLNNSKNCLEDIYFTTCSDVFHQNLRNHGLVQPIRRVILVANTQYCKREEVRNALAKAVKQIQQEIEDAESKITGLLIVHENFFYHAFECSDVTIGEIIKLTLKLKIDGLIFGAKVVRSCGIVNRYFKNWNNCIIRTPNYIDTEQNVKTEGEESSFSEVAQMVKKMEDVIFVLASYVRYLKSNEIEEKVNELVPVGVLAFREELLQLYKEPFFLTVEDYVSFYLTPQEYTSYLEQEWPPTSPLHDAATYIDEIESFEKDVGGVLLQEDIKIRSGKKWKKLKKKLGAVTALQQPEQLAFPKT